MKKVAYLIAQKDFKDEEYFTPREILEENKITVVTFSNKDGEAKGAQGGEVEVQDFENISPEEFDGLLIAGGPGAPKYLDKKEVYNLTKDFFSLDKLVGAICISSTILAKAGLLKGKRATVWTSQMDKSAVEVLEDNGADYVDKSVVIDGNILTADGPDSAKEFGREAVKLLTID